MPKKNPKEKRLKHNPKLAEKNGKKEVPTRPYEEPYEYSRNYTPYFMVIVFISVILVIAVIFIFVFDANAKRVEKYDEVRMDYEIYTLEQYEKHKDPEIKKTDTWVNCCSRYDDDCEDDGLIEGFYQKLLGLREGDVINNELIEACQDDDKDGEDDNTEKDALSYGFPDDKLYDEDIVLWAKVYEINKTSDSEEDTEAFISYYENNGVLKIFNTIHQVLFKKIEFSYFYPLNLALEKQ